jgi:hypothetical protein
MADLNRFASITRSTTGAICTGSGVLHGYYVGTTTSAAVTLTDGKPSPTTVLVIPAAVVVGTAVLGLDIAFATSLTATFAGSGSLTFIYA